MDHVGQRFARTNIAVSDRRIYPNLSTGAVVLYLLMAGHCQGSRCTMPQSAMAEARGVTTREVRYLLTELVDEGLIERRRRPNKTTVTVLLEPRGEEVPLPVRTGTPTSGPDVAGEEAPLPHKYNEKNKNEREKEREERPAHTPDTPTEGDTMSPALGRDPDRDDDPNADEFGATARVKKRRDLVKPDSSEWLNQEFTKLCVEHLRTGRYNRTIFNTAVKDLREAEGISYAEVGAMLPIWILRDPNLREKAREHDPAIMFRQEINNGLLLRYRKHLAMGAADTVETTPVTTAQQEWMTGWKTTTEETTG